MQGRIVTEFYLVSARNEWARYGGDATGNETAGRTFHVHRFSFCLSFFVVVSFLFSFYETILFFFCFFFINLGQVFVFLSHLFRVLAFARGGIPERNQMEERKISEENIFNIK